MSKQSEFLKEWCIRFLENKDSVKREIKSIKEESDTHFSIDYTSSKKEFYIFMELGQDSLTKIPQEIPTGIFTLNNSKSIGFLIAHWDTFAKNNKQMLYFINPFSKADKVWIINPYVHNMICDPDSLKTGIKAMSEMVQEITESELKEKL